MLTIIAAAAQQGEDMGLYPCMSLVAIGVTHIYVVVMRAHDHGALRALLYRMRAVRARSTRAARAALRVIHRAQRVLMRYAHPTNTYMCWCCGVRAHTRQVRASVLLS